MATGLAADSLLLDAKLFVLQVDIVRHWFHHQTYVLALPWSHVNLIQLNTLFNGLE